MKKNNSLMIITLEQDLELTLDELCHACNVTPDFIRDMMEYGIIDPEGFSPQSWRFNADHLGRIKKVIHLQHDLEINLAGAALVLDMLDTMEEMRARLEWLEKR